MASTPTTKSQVQAYRFVLRRMESALVRKDPVMLHDPMRGHRRSTATGAVIAVAGLLGFLVFGVLKPDPTVPSSGIVIGQPSGQIYVVNGNPHELIPVFNLASARLLLMAEGGSASAANSAGGATPTVVNDAQLNTVSTGRLTGIPDGPQVLPAPASAPQVWAVCDDSQVVSGAPAASAQGSVQTTVLAGVSDLGTELPAGAALYVSGPDGKTYLIYRLQHDVNNENDSEVRAEVDPNNSAVMTVLKLGRAVPTKMSAALLNAIPDVGQITNPAADVAHESPIVPLPAGVSVGRSFEVQDPSVPGGYDYYVALPDGAEQVSAMVAQIVSNASDQSEITPVPGGAIDQFKPHTGKAGDDPLNVSNYPGTVPTAIEVSHYSTLCLGWQADLSNTAKPIARTWVTVRNGLPLPVDKATGTAMNRVQVGTPNANGQKIDYFLMNGAAGETVHAAANANQFWSGQIDLISARGVVYTIPDIQTAQGLGVADNSAHNGIYPAPESIVSLLPTSPQALTTQNVQRTFDTLSVPATAGQYTAVNTTAASGGGP